MKMLDNTTVQEKKLLVASADWNILDSNEFYNTVSILTTSKHLKLLKTTKIKLLN